jgi:hypothetical protein
MPGGTMKKVLAKYDDANLIKERLRLLGIPVNLFGRYVGKSSSEICSLLNGTKRVSKTRAEQFTRAIKDLEMVARAFGPAPISFKEREQILGLIRDFNSGDLIVGVSYFGNLVLTGSGKADGGW